MMQEPTIQTADGIPLKKKIAQALFKQKIRALLLIAPLLIFILFSFVIPVLFLSFPSFLVIPVPAYARINSDGNLFKMKKYYLILNCQHPS